MVMITLITAIGAPIKRCFDLARCIDAHLGSAASSAEQAISGVTAGLIGLNQHVTWRGRHFGFWYTHTSRITVFEPPVFFQDSMVKGAFKSFCHDHCFEHRDGLTTMTDILRFEAPYGWLGKMAECLFLKTYLRRFLEKRNQFLKRTAESEDWKRFLL